jgi:hypothetical protein
MRDMYRRAAVVPIWIGDEKIHTEDAFQVRSACGRIRYITADGGLFRKRTSESHRHPNFLGPYHSSLAGDCTSQVFWAGVIDPLSTRTYFSRLWIIQENVLSSKLWLCGKIIKSSGSNFKGRSQKILAISTG